MLFGRSVGGGGCTDGADSGYVTGGTAFHTGDAQKGVSTGGYIYEGLYLPVVAGGDEGVEGMNLGAGLHVGDLLIDGGIVGLFFYITNHT